ncbi:M14 family metallopeptidase [Falsibacillus albus]|uniref:LysM peptidoglycan-binding domain-containing protein n=1 Tax=Falsibacillus albus TaxID=2478915 RepID=A0A3L7K579_9BACI|nr:M14 family metallopeptidase [Falsibacillus albus]RLQ98236.1 LysM peptidoglycan-binding domain-containing protein [Falsibacillus albus]
MKIKAREGDTLTSLSQAFYIPVPLIQEANGRLDSDVLTPGKQVDIPGYESEQYRLRQGDSLWEISRRCEVREDAILMLNQGISFQSIQPDKVILIPSRIKNIIITEKVPYNFDTFNKDLLRLLTVYPFIKKRVIGRSVLNQPIIELKIGRGKEKVHWNGSFHANEWITTPVIMKFINELALSVTNGKEIMHTNMLKIFETRSISIVPMVNPDGVDLVLNGPPSHIKDKLIQLNGGRDDFTGWKANIRGVDLNKQFPARWQDEKQRKNLTSPGPRDYGGIKPLSEPETIVMAKLAQKEKFDVLLAFHTQGQEFYWGFGGLEPQKSKSLAEAIEKMSGYSSVQFIDSYAGYKDWFIKKFRNPGFTIELGKGINPLPLSQFDEIYSASRGIFIASLLY